MQSRCTIPCPDYAVISVHGRQILCTMTLDLAGFRETLDLDAYNFEGCKYSILVLRSSLYSLSVAGTWQDSVRSEVKWAQVLT